jgi:hypothetical protein
MGARLRDPPRDVERPCEIARTKVSWNRNSRETERKFAGDVGKRFVRSLPSRGAVGDQADAMTARDLTAGKVDHMTE